MKTKTRLTFDKVQHDQTNPLHCVVSLQAPRLEWEKKRPPVCILNVVDISGSMTGDKLHYAKQSVLKLADHLKPGDWCGVVAFESGIHEVFAPREMTQDQKEKLKSKVGALRPMGCTNFSGGMLKALELAKGLDLPEKVQVRVIMFTDGHANEGVATDLASLAKLLKANKGRATLSAFGYGTDADQDLLADLAKTGGGNYAFVRNPEDALTAFARELGGLLSTYATDVEVEVQPCNGHRITEVVSDVESTEAGKGVKISIPNLYSEEELHLVMGLTLSEQSKALPRKMNVAEVTVTFKVMSEEGELVPKTVKDKAKVRFVKAGAEQTEPTKEVDEVVSLAQLIQAQIQAEEQANAGNYSAAVQVMHVASSGLKAKGMHNYANLGMKLGRQMSAVDCYADSAGYRNSSKHLGTRAVSIPSSDAEAQADFINLGVSTSNAAQEKLVKSFTSTGASSPKVPASGSVQVLPADDPQKGSVGFEVEEKLGTGALSKSRSSRW